MKTILEFLRANAPYSLATVENNKPKVRPIGFPLEVDGKLSFYTSKVKNMYKQLESNANAEICALGKMGWMRISGTVTFNDSPEITQKWLEVAPFLKFVYKDRPELLTACSFDGITVEFRPVQGSDVPEFVAGWETFKDAEGGIVYTNTY